MTIGKSEAGPQGQAGTSRTGQGKPRSDERMGGPWRGEGRIGEAGAGTRRG